jgi:hypothetical protein
LAKSASERVSRSILYTTTMSTRAAVISSSSRCRAGHHRRAEEPAIVINSRQAHPAFVPLAVDERLAGLALRLQRIEFLLEPLLRRFAGID